MIDVTKTLEVFTGVTKFDVVFVAENSDFFFVLKKPVEPRYVVLTFNKDGSSYEIGHWVLRNKKEVVYLNFYNDGSVSSHSEKEEANAVASRFMVEGHKFEDSFRAVAVRVELP